MLSEPFQSAWSFHTEIQILQLPHGQLHIAQNGVLGKIGANQVDHFYLAAVRFCRSTPLRPMEEATCMGVFGQRWSYSRFLQPNN